MMNIVHALRYVALGAVVLAGAWGCATRAEPIALSQARTQYMQAQQNPQITAYAPVALREAEQPLRQAERLWAEDKDEAEVQHLAYVSERRIEIARAAAEQKLAEADIQRLGEERDQVLIQGRTREARQARQEAQQATTQAARLEQELAALKAQQTDRGLVLTLSDVLFEFNRADLKPGAMRTLYPLVTFLKENPTRTVSIEGHTDSIGSQSYNLELSELRADAVRHFLMAQGIDAGRITTVGYGKAYPVASNDTEAGRQQNRRVEVVMQ
jgi:OmpA-OmpF porin, OOP family